MTDVQITVEVALVTANALSPEFSAESISIALVEMIEAIFTVSVPSVGNASLHAIPAPNLVQEKEELALCV